MRSGPSPGFAPNVGRSKGCPACGAAIQARSPSRDSRPDPRPVRCSLCGMVRIDPVPAAALDPETYGRDYYEAWQGREEGWRTALWRRRLAQVEARSPVGTLLDIGCGDGLFAAIARGTGWSVEGVEFSPEGARRAAQRLGRPVAVGDLACEPLLRGPFDVITMWHVLEHLRDPAAMLMAVRARLRPEGLLVVAVPNLDNLPMQVAYRLARRRPLPLYEPGAREPHLSHFAPPTLALLLRRHRFERLELLADRCALDPPKRLIDAAASVLSRLTGRLLTDAMVAFARAPR